MTTKNKLSKTYQFTTMKTAMNGDLIASGYNFNKSQTPIMQLIAQQMNIQRKVARVR